MTTVDRIRRILFLLNKAYGKPRPYRRSDPIDEIIRTVLSQNTNDKNSLAAFAVLKNRFKPWPRLLYANVSKVAGSIKHAGLSNIKARRIKDVLAEIHRREGRLSLSRLKDFNIEEASEYLMSLKGIGPKTAACVLLFSFNKPVMPVDTHIFRIAKRLGLIDKNADIKEAHKALSGAIPKDLIYNFHLGIIEHGRRTCKAQNPRCGFCALYTMCKFKDKIIYKRRG